MSYRSRYCYYYIIIYFKVHSGSDSEEIRIKSQ